LKQTKKVFKPATLFCAVRHKLQRCLTDEVEALKQTKKEIQHGVNTFRLCFNFLFLKLSDSSSLKLLESRISALSRAEKAAGPKC
jgi:hypothetical protein